MEKISNEIFNFNLLPFDEWLNEEGEGSVLNTTDQIAQKDQPLGVKKKKKNEEDECEEDESESE
jgi:hypothetical protein